MTSRPVLIALAALTLGGCAQLPTTAGVDRLEPSGPAAVLAAPGIGAIPPAPPRDADPLTLTGAFLIALGAPQEHFAGARAYLTPTAAARWQPGNDVVIYTGDPVVDPIGSTAVDITVTPSGQLDARGEYTPTPGAPPQHITVHVVRVGDQWRYSQVPNVALVSQDEFTTAFTGVALYFDAVSGRGLVPDPVFLPGPRSELAAETVTALGGGPTPRLAGAVTTALPAGTVIGPATLSGGNLNVPLAGASPGPVARSQFLDQLVATMSSFPEVTAAIRLVGASGVLASADAEPAGSALAPALGTQAWAVRGASLVGLTTGTALPLTDAADHLPLAAPALTPGASGVAGLVCHPICSALDMGVAGVAPHRVLTVTDALTAPTVAPSGTDFWTATVSTSPELYEVGPHGVVHKWALTLPAPGTLRALAVSPDGARVVVVVGTPSVSAVYVGVILPAAGGSLGRWIELSAGLTVTFTATWTAADTVGVLAEASGATGVAPYELSIDGASAPSPALGQSLPDAATSFASAPGLTQYVSTATNVYRLSGQIWRKVTAGAFVTYPG